MTETQVQQIVDGLFSLLKTELKTRPFLLLSVEALQTVADGLIPKLVTNVNATPTK